MKEMIRRNWSDSYSDSDVMGRYELCISGCLDKTSLMFLVVAVPISTQRVLVSEG